MTGPKPQLSNTARIVRIVVTALAVVSFLVRLLADVAFAGIVDDQPLLLIALNARIRTLFFVADQLDWVPYYTVGFFRITISEMLNYLVGFWYGDRALRWVKARSRTYGPLLDQRTEWIHGVGFFLCFFAPSSYVSALLGATKARFRNFVALLVAGTLVRLVTIRTFSQQIEPSIVDIRGFIDRYQLWFIMAAFVGVAWSLYQEYAASKSSGDVATETATNTNADNAANTTNASELSTGQNSSG